MRSSPLAHPIEQAQPPVPQEPPSFLRRTFQAFHFRDFRWMWIGACTSQIGSQMQTMVQSWVVLDLSKDNSFYLGVDQFLGQIPIVLFALLAGVVADRKDRRRVLLGSQYTQMTCAFLIALLAFTNVLEVWQIWCLSFIVGTAQAFGGPSYSALVPSLVPREHLPNAIALNSIQFNLARVIGPSLGGVVLPLGAALCFGLNGVSFLAVIVTLYVIHVGFVPPKSKEPILESMKQGVRFILAQNGMKALIVLAFMVTLLGFQLIAFLPVFARGVFHASPQMLGVLAGCSGAGSVTGALIVAALGRTKHQGRTGLLALCALGVLTVGFAASPNVVVACIMIFFTGMCLMTVFSTLTSLVQLITPDEMRGRVMSVYNLALRGGGPIGAPIVGALIPVFGVRVVVGTAGVLMVCLGLFFLLVNRRVASL